MMAEQEGLSDKVKSAINKAKGEVKDQVGNAKNDPKLQAEGKVDKAKGDIQEKVAEKKADRDNDEQ